MANLRYLFFVAEPKSGYNFPFIVVYPQNLASTCKIFVEAYNHINYSGHSSFSEQIKDAISCVESRCQKPAMDRFNSALLYSTINNPIIVPIIERCDNEHNDEFYTQMLGRNVMLSKNKKFERIDKQVIAMINKVKQMLSEKQIATTQKSAIFGISASGVFATRMTFLHPEEFDTNISVCANALIPLPMNEYNGQNLIYPLGTEDYEKITGKKFDLAEYKTVKQLFIIGREEEERYNIVREGVLNSNEVSTLWRKTYGNVTLQERFQAIKKVLGDITNIECHLVDGGHTYSSKGNLIVKAVNKSLENVNGANKTL
ncbi:MAG: hypothetical protein AB7S44_03445 [Spirochaetales bacterium]